MITIDNIQIRNLQEQVEKNKSDLEYILTEEGVLNEFGIRITEQISDISELPTVDDYKEGHTGWEYGDCIAVGDEEPYELYILTRANGGHPDDYWFDLGVFPLPGPQGEQGIQGIQGEQGIQGIQGKQGIIGPRGVAGLGTYIVGANLNPVIGSYTSVNYSDIDTNRTVQSKDLLIGTNDILGRIESISQGICQVLTITNLSGGYIMLDITDADLYNKATNAIAANKPVMIHEANGIPYYAKTIKIFGTTVVIRADNGIIAVLSDGTVYHSNNITNIQAIPAPILTAIECGEILIKVTDGEKYEYRVSRKKENTSICLTYVDASVVETVSYDKIPGGWEYKSTVKSPDILEVTNITTITTEQLNALKAGDIVIKKTSGSGRRFYTVSYRENIYISLTCVDATKVETVSYDYTDGAWIYRATILTPLT